MEEQLISFETAKLAKEKGFDIHTKHKWVEQHPIFKKDPILMNIQGNIGDKALSYAPTQSLLQKWLRDKHSIIVETKIYSGL